MIIKKAVAAKNEESLESAYNDCLRKNIFKTVETDPKKFLERAQYDFAKAKTDLANGDYVWAVIKSYFSIFHASNAALLKKKGYFSKDHGCLYVTLKKYNLIPHSLFDRLSDISKSFDENAFFTLMDARKTSTYDILAWKDVEKDDAKIVIGAAEEIINIAREAIF